MAEVEHARLLQIIENIEIKSVDFHFKRQDFQKRIRETIGDEYLAIGKII